MSRSNRRALLQQAGLGLFATALPSAALGYQTPAAPARSVFRREDRERRFQKVWEAVRDGFYDPKMHGVDWPGVGDRYRPEALAAESLPRFREVVQRMLNELRASHLEYYTDDQFEYYFFRSLFAPEQPVKAVEHIGVMGPVRDEVLTVKALFDGGPAAKAGLQVGDRLLRAGGRPFSTSGAFRGLAGKPVSIELERPGSGRLSVQVSPVAETGPGAFAAATRNSTRVIERNGRRLAYVHLWTLTHREILEPYERPLRDEMADTDGLILDLRDGFGGYIERFDYVLYRPDLVMEITPRDGKPQLERSGYGKPMVAIINEGSRSAKEYFAYQLRKMRRATLVGTRTAGYFLGGGYAPIENDGLMMLPRADLRLDGKRLEGKGVEPHVTVKAGESYTLRDRQVEAAARELLKKLDR